MYFTVNLAFVDNQDQLNETINTPIVRNWTNQKQILPISLESFEINSSLIEAPKTLREFLLEAPKTLSKFLNQYKEKRKLMDI